jgi:pimeloyl-ACP methyl ester carboxylesterase
VGHRCLIWHIVAQQGDQPDPVRHAELAVSSRQVVLDRAGTKAQLLGDGAGVGTVGSRQDHSDGWNPIRAYWKEPTQANRDAIRSLVQPETTVWQYTHGVADPSLVSPDGYTLDNHYLDRPGADEIQLDLFLDYASNIDLYPRFQDYFRTCQPRLLAIWGRNDPFFLPEGAEAFKRDIPAADVRLLDTGHFALETHAGEIATAIRGFLLSPAGAAPAPTGGA